MYSLENNRLSSILLHYIHLNKLGADIKFTMKQCKETELCEVTLFMCLYLYFLTFLGKIIKK